MRQVVYYFSGTGNSLALARSLAERIDAEAAPIARFGDGRRPESVASVGLVFPTFMYRPPGLVVRFLEKLPRPEYLYIVAVNGGDPGNVIEHTERHMGRHGLVLDAGFKVRLPDNYTPFGGPPPPEKQAELFAAAEERVAEIAGVVQARRPHRDPGPGWLRAHVYPGIWYAIGYWAIPTYDKNFRVTDRCVSCESCSKVCPVGNVTMRDGHPTWGGHCEQCLACLHWCNKEAIELGGKTAGVPRYRNPQVKRRQIIAQTEGD